MFTLVLLALTLLLPQRAYSAPPNCTTPTVNTSGGPICGLQLKENKKPIRTYLGIPYAESTTGPRRWTSPTPAKLTSKPFKATKFGPLCPQDPSQTPGARQSEDCLSLNIWTPHSENLPDSTDSDLPVMVFIHGGSFLHEGSLFPVYDGKRMAALGNVVVVTLNYRLGALGFLAGLDGLTGNYGFLDQQLALKWVQDNIAGFGGDPSKVTLFGQSAGAMSIGLHLISPQSEKLFRAAIMESNPYGLPYKTLKKAAKFAHILRDSVECKQGGLNCLRDAKSVPAQLLVQHQSSDKLELQGALEGFAGQLLWAPVIDGKLIPRQANQSSINKPVLLGTNLNEGVLFAAEQQVKIPLKKNKTLPKLLYEFELLTFFPLTRVFKILDKPRYRSREGDNTEVLSRLLTDYLFTCPNQYMMKQANNKVYAYQFDQVPSFFIWPKVRLCAPNQNKVCHAAELPFVFGNPRSVALTRNPTSYQFRPEEKKLSDTMIRYWTSFATYLSPNQNGLSPWPPFRDKHPLRLILKENIFEKTKLEANCDFWDSIGYDLRG